MNPSNRWSNGALLLLASGFTASCGPASSNQSNTKFSLGLSLLDATRGHEDITRFAVEIANQRIKDELGLSGYFTKIPFGENGGRSPLPMIKGSFDTDWAVTLVQGKRSGETLLNYYGVAWIQTGSEWQDFPWLQSLHFLRDRDANDNVFDLQESLDSSRERVTKSFQQAIATSGKRDISNYWLGHLLHTIQDSFSSVHTQRSDDFKRIKNLCTFGKNTAADACKHPEPLAWEGDHPITGAVFEEDRVWIPDSDACDGPSERSWDCLKPEAQKAAEVSAGALVAYVRIVGNRLSSPKSDGFREINDFMLNDRVWQGGHFKGIWE